MVEDLHRDHACLVGDVAANHQHHAEFAHGVGETEDAGGDEAWAGQRQHYVDEGVPRAGAQRGGYFQRALANGAEGILQWLDNERHGVDHRADHQAGEAEHHAAQAQRLGRLAQPAMRAEGDQQVETDHRGRQHQRQGHYRAYRPAQPRARARQPPGDGRADDQQDQGGQAGQFHGQPDGTQVTGVQWHQIS